MSQLLLSDDEIALLRWTCELFFVPESPAHRVDADAREPADFAATYAELVRKGVLDETSFRLTDMALNRLAPLTECDARVVMLLPSESSSRPRQRDYFLLDEIGVEYEFVDGMHAVGPDQDHQELVAGLVRRFSPRRASGDFLNFRMTPTEFLLFCVLGHRARQGHGHVMPDALLAEIRPALVDNRVYEGLGPVRRRARDAHADDAGIRHRAAQLMAAAPSEASPLQDITARAQQPVNDQATQVMRARPAATARLPEEADTVVNVRSARRSSSGTATPRAAASDARPAAHSDEPDAAELAMASLLQKGIALQDPRGLSLRPSIHNLAVNLTERSRHTFVRFDFADDEWFTRETSFLHVDGSLFSLHTEDTGEVCVVELDARRLETALARAVGPLPETEEGGGGRSAKDFLLRA